MIADLHVHTRFSDGSYSINQVINKAWKKGLSHLGIVDHDTTAGVEPARKLGLLAGVTVVSGIEISAYDFKKGRKIHILGYNFDSPAGSIEHLCETVRLRRHKRTLCQIGRLAEAGYPVSVDEVREVAAEGFSPEELRMWPGVLFKQHIMALFIRKGIADAIYGDLYRRLFKGPGICAGDIRYVDVYEAIEAVRDDGGLAVLAHPGQQNCFDIIDDLAKKGLQGVEVYHPDHTPAQRELSRTAARRNGLFLTGGSDDHGAFGSTAEIGEITAPTQDLMRLLSAGNPDPV